MQLHTHTHPHNSEYNGGGGRKWTQNNPKQRQECTLRTALKVATEQITDRQSAKLFSSRRNWDSPNPSPAGECAPPLCFRGKGGGGQRNTRWRERGVGRVQFRRGDIHCGTLNNFVVQIMYRYRYLPVTWHRVRRKIQKIANFLPQFNTIRPLPGIFRKQILLNA